MSSSLHRIHKHEYLWNLFDCIDFCWNEIKKWLKCFVTGLLSDKDVDIHTSSIISDDFGWQFEMQSLLNIGDNVGRECSGECGERNFWKGDMKLMNPSGKSKMIAFGEFAKFREFLQNFKFKSVNLSQCYHFRFA